MNLVKKTYLNRPATKDDFEDLCLSIAREYWDDPSARRMGGDGHKQYGIDIISPRAKVNGKYYRNIIQAKKKKTGSNQKLTMDDVTDTLQKLEEYPEQIDQLVIATTSDIDPKLQMKVDEINKQRAQDGKCPVVLWFWDHIEGILHDRCHETFAEYVMQTLPSEAKNLAAKEVLEKLLFTAEEYARDNQIEKSSTVLNFCRHAVDQMHDLELTKKVLIIEALISQKTERTQRHLDIVEEILVLEPTELSALAMKCEIGFVDHDFETAASIVQKMEEVDASSPITKNMRMLLKLNTQEKIDVPVITGNAREQAATCAIYHIYCNRQGDYSGRDEYLEKQRVIRPNTASPVYYKILYLMQDAANNISSLRYEDAEKVSQEISNLELSLKEKDPLTPWQIVRLLTEKYKFTLLKCHEFSTGYDELINLERNIIEQLPFCNQSKEVFRDLVELLRATAIDSQSLKQIVSYLLNNGNKIPDDLAYTLVSQAMFADKSLSFAYEICETLRLEKAKLFLKAVEENDFASIVNHIKSIDIGVQRGMVGALPDKNLIIRVIDEILPEVLDPVAVESFNQLKIFCLMYQEGSNVVSALRGKLDLSKQGRPFLISLIKYSEKQGFHDLTAECLKIILDKYKMPDDQRVHDQGHLVFVSHLIEDHPQVLLLVDDILKSLELLEEPNRSLIVDRMVDSSFKRDRSDRVVEILDRALPLMPFNFAFYVRKAEAQNKLNDDNAALTTMLLGLKKEKNLTNRHFLGCQILVSNFENSGALKNHDQNYPMEDYKKISGIDAWYYIGDDIPIDAVKLEKTDPRYEALINKTTGQDFDWPPDEFSTPGIKRTIEWSLREASYVACRCGLALNKAASEGMPGVWLVNLPEGEDILKNIERFFAKQNGPRDEVIKQYKEKLLPFSLLMNVFGNMPAALSKLTADGGAFIWVNDGSHETHQHQKALAKRALEGEAVYIDGTALLFLINGGIIDEVVNNIDNLYYTPSVTALVADHIVSIEPRGQKLSLRMEKGDAYPVITEEADAQKSKNDFIAGLALFEAKALKRTVDFISTKNNETEKILPASVTDPFAAARAAGLNVISEDFIYTKAISPSSTGFIPASISSLALAEVFLEEGIISRDKFLRYVSRLLVNNVSFKSISPKEIIDTMMPLEKGVIHIRPENIKFLHLELTLSEKYGVNEVMAAGLVAETVVILIRDETVNKTVFRSLAVSLLNKASKEKSASFKRLISQAVSVRLSQNGMLIPTQTQKDKYEELIVLLRTSLIV